MTELSQDQIAFLQYHRIPASLVFDASGMRASRYKARMKEEGKAFAFGVTPCGAAGHELRTRAGHCVQCDTSKIAYMMRHDNSGQVYVAGSLAGSLIKVGTTQAYFERQASLRNSAYAGYADWKILAYVECRRAGQCEGEVQAALADWRAKGNYYKGGFYQECYELFRCCAEVAIAELERLSGADRGRLARVTDSSPYQFGN